MSASALSVFYWKSKTKLLRFDKYLYITDTDLKYNYYCNSIILFIPVETIYLVIIFISIFTFHYNYIIVDTYSSLLSYKSMS